MPRFMKYGSMMRMPKKEAISIRGCIVLTDISKEDDKGSIGFLKTASGDQLYYYSPQIKLSVGSKVNVLGHWTFSKYSKRIEIDKLEEGDTQ